MDNECLKGSSYYPPTAVRLGVEALTDAYIFALLLNENKKAKRYSVEWVIPWSPCTVSWVR